MIRIYRGYAVKGRRLPEMEYKGSGAGGSGSNGGRVRRGMDKIEIKRQDFTERIKRRNKKPKFICELLTDDNKIIRTYCWNEELPEKVEILLDVEDGNIYKTREATTKELVELLEKGNINYVESRK